MKKSLIIFIVLVVLFLGFLGFVWKWWTDQLQPVSGSSEKVHIVINKGSSAEAIANQLSKSGLIKSPLAFKLYTQIYDKADKIQNGEFNLSYNMSLPDIVNRLMQGPDQLWVTIPEGLRREEIVLKVMTALTNNDETFYQGFMKASNGKEGQLFPDTYLFPRDITAEQVVNKMLATFDQKKQDLVSNSIVNNPRLSDGQILTLASLIEREASSDEERPTIAGILYNRLKNDWPLQIDAAVQYAIAGQQCQTKNTASVCPIDIARSVKWWPVLTKDDLEINSPYNTYKYPGIPPAPISNPGLSSIQAAYNPQSTDYFFYLHDKDGNIHYAKTLEEHNSNIAKYLDK